MTPAFKVFSSIHCSGPLKKVDLLSYHHILKSNLTKQLILVARSLESFQDNRTLENLIMNSIWHSVYTIMILCIWSCISVSGHSCLSLLLSVVRLTSVTIPLEDLCLITFELLYIFQSNKDCHVCNQFYCLQGHFWKFCFKVLLRV